jgi:glycosyltransferase involved in cell wall biosynthesis
MPNREIRILCILSTILGNRRMTERLLQAFGTMPDVAPIPVIMEPEDYQRFTAPWWARLTNPWESQHIAWQKSLPYLAQPFDMLLVNSWEYVIKFRAVARRVPAVAMLDAVPATMDHQLRNRGQGGWKRKLSNAVHSSQFGKAVSGFDYLLPMGSDCADSLAADYRCDPNRCRVTLAPQDLDEWRPTPRTWSAPLRLLFVGNDFERKGGEFLLALYSTHLKSSCRLVIASTDPALAGRNWPEGVTLVQGQTREQMADVYRQNDLFVFPTQQDFTPQVLAEALAMGMPCIANDVGSIRDMVRTGETGVLMSRTDPPELWARRIQELIGNPAELAHLSAGARRFAEENLSLARFEGLIGDVIQHLREVAKHR